MARNRCRGTLPLAALILAVTAAGTAHRVHASDARSGAPPDARSPAPTRASLENKLRLVGMLLAQSPAVLRIPGSGNAEAIKLLADARALHDAANGEAAAGRTAAAVDMLNQSLQKIASAARLVPDPAQQLALERARYNALRESTHAFSNLHEGLLARMAERKPEPASLAPDSSKIAAVLAQAAELAAANRYIQANALLQDAYNSVVTALNRMLMAKTIVYDQNFSSPADEYRHELARNRNYEDLLPLALTQLNPGPEVSLLSERSAQQSRVLRETAQQQAGRGDYAAAVKSLHEATEHLQRSLRIAGVIVPQPLKR